MELSEDLKYKIYNSAFLQNAILGCNIEVDNWEEFELDIENELKELVSMAQKEAIENIEKRVNSVFNGNYGTTKKDYEREILNYINKLKISNE